MSTIVLNTLNYVGQGIVNGLAWFWERSAGISAGFKTLQNRVTQTTDKVNVGWKLTYPVLVTASSSCACEGDLAFVPTIVDVTVRFDKRAPSAHRDDVQASLEALVITQQFRDSVKLLVQAQ